MRFFYVLAMAVAAAGLASCSGAHEPPPEHAVATKLIFPPQLDVQALVGASIDELRRRVGPPQPIPAAFADPMLRLNTLEGNDSLTAFQRNGLTVLATYDVTSRQVSDLLVAGHNEDSLMQRAHLQANMPGYIILPLFANRRNGQLLGLRVIPIK